ncbi:MAG: class II aldolase/adducin family protein [Chloroflexota bacterium]
MIEAEGVIKFRMTFTQAEPMTQVQLSELNGWRKAMVYMQMIGQTPERYDNYGFGNISRRLTADEAPGYAHPFVISGTQTGGIADLEPIHYASVLECQPKANHVIAEGPMKPSSESMTHGMVYVAAPEVNWIIHAHDPHIWHVAEALDVPCTAESVSYGTPEMSAEVLRLFRETDVAEKRIFSMAGHEDGIVTFGKTATEAGEALLHYLAMAMAM